MSGHSQPSMAAAKKQEVLITRVIDAPRELVFKAWTDPASLVRWFAPRGCTIHFASIDVRQGGEFHSCINNPKFGACWCKGVYRELVTPERIVFSMSIADDKGNLVEPQSAGHDGAWPATTVVTVTLVEQTGKTLLTLHQNVSEVLAKKTGAHPSWLEMLDRLAGEVRKV